MRSLEAGEKEISATGMKEKPIIFNSEMVRAILDGRKTQTRRVFKFQETNQPPSCPDMFDPNYVTQPCPYGKPGDELWVREALKRSLTDIICYKQDGCPAWKNGSSQNWQWKRSILSAMFMPRWASRIQLKIKDIRVERIQDISEDDIFKEGFEIGEVEKHKYTRAFLWFQSLWDSINEKRGFGWEQNPHVWIIEFKRINHVS